MSIETVTALVVADKRIEAAKNLAASVASMGYTIADADTRIMANDDLHRIKQGIKAIDEVKKECKKPARELVALVDTATAPYEAALKAAVPLIEDGMRKWDRAEAARVEAARREQQRIIDEQRAAEAKAAKEAEETGMEFEPPPPAAQVVVTEKPRAEQSRGGVSQTVVQRRVEATLVSIKDALEAPEVHHMLSLDEAMARRWYKTLSDKGLAPDFPAEGGIIIGGIQFTTKETYASRPGGGR